MRPRPPLPLTVGLRPLTARPAGLAAMVYTRHLRAMAAGSKQAEEGGNSRNTNKRSSGEPNHERWTQPHLDANKKLDNLVPPNLGETTHGRDANANLRVPQQDGDGETPWKFQKSQRTSSPEQEGVGTSGRGRTQLFRYEALDTEHLGELHHEKSREILKQAKEEAVDKAWQGRLDWVASPVKRLLKPYMDWKMGAPKLTLPSPKSIKPGLQQRSGKRRLLGKRQYRLIIEKNKKDNKRKTKGVKMNDTNQKKGTVKDFEEGFYATTSRKPRESRRRLVATILEDECPGTKGSKFGIHSLTKLAAVLKSRGYKAIKPYVIEAKMMHLDRGGDWSPAWDRKFKLCMRAATRDAGPAKKAVEVKKEHWAGGLSREENYGKTNMDKKLKVCLVAAKAAFAVATHWMLREIELADLQHKDVAFDVLKRRVTLTWTKSKTDTEARGMCRVLQCTCTSQECDLHCPYEATWRLVHGGGLETTIQCIGEGYILKSLQGKKVRKCDIVAAWKTLYGADVTGHSPRRTGALQYIRDGWTISQVAFLGRWRSQVIYDYAREAMESVPVNACKTFSVDGNTPRNKPSSETTGTVDPEETEKREWNKERLVELDAELVALKLDCQGMKRKLADEVKSLENKANSRSGLLPGYVFSGRAQVTHENEEITICSPPFTWKTLCGWRYSGANFTLQDGTIGGVTCAKCKTIAQNRRGDKGDQ